MLSQFLVIYSLAVLDLHCCAQASHCSASLVVEHTGSVVALHTPASLFCSMWDLPGAGIEPTMSPALAGGFLTTRPPEKS